MVPTTGRPTLRQALGRGYDALIEGMGPVLGLVSLRDLRFGLAEMPDVAWADALDQPPASRDRPVASRRQLRALRERLVHLDGITRYPQPLSVELGELLASVPSIRPLWAEIVVDLWGWNGQGRKSLELVAWRHHVTRERIRHVAHSVHTRLAQTGRPAYLPTAQAIADIVTELGDAAAKIHVARLARGQELITQTSELDALEALQAVGLVPPGTWRWAAPAGAVVRRRGRRRSPQVAAQLNDLRQLVTSLETRKDAYLVTLEPGEKPATIRRRLLQAAAEVGVEVALRKHDDGWVVGLMTAHRRSGRKLITA